MRIGVISDTHGLLRDSALEAMQGCDQIIHAGDIGNASILAALTAIAPLSAVRGNNDTQSWAAELPEQLRLQCGALEILVVHDLAQLGAEQRQGAVRVIVSGHSHQPKISEQHGVIYLNPGSAGPRRFRLPVSVAELIIRGATPEARLIELQP